MPKAPNFGVNNTLKLNKVSIFEKLFLKFGHSIKNPILKMIDYDLSIQNN